MLNLNLDKKNDVLYMSFSDKGNSYGKEMEDGEVIFYDMVDGSITGITIFDFLKRNDFRYNIYV